MLKMLPALLLLAAATSASAATYDPCLVAGAMTRDIAEARDHGVMLSTFLIEASGKFETEEEQELYFRRVAQIYLTLLPYNADELAQNTIDGCNAE